MATLCFTARHFITKDECAVCLKAKDSRGCVLVAFAKDAGFENQAHVVCGIFESKSRSLVAVIGVKPESIGFSTAAYRIYNAQKLFFQ